MKVIKFLENRGILLIFIKKTTAEITRQEVGLSNFLRPLMAAGLQLMKTVLTSSAKSVSLTFDLSPAIFTNKYSYLRENLWICHSSINNFK